MEPTPADRCPDCAGPVTVSTLEEPAMMYFGGYGASRRTVERLCPCGWSLVSEVSEIRP